MREVALFVENYAHREVINEAGCCCMSRNSNHLRNGT